MQALKALYTCVFICNHIFSDFNAIALAFGTEGENSRCAF